MGPPFTLRVIDSIQTKSSSPDDGKWRTVRCLVDTGNHSYTIINHRLAQKMELDRSTQGSIFVRGFGGGHKIPIAKCRFRIGPVEYETLVGIGDVSNYDVVLSLRDIRFLQAQGMKIRL